MTLVDNALPVEWKNEVRLMRLRGVTMRPTSREQALGMLDAGECIFCPRVGFKLPAIHIARVHQVNVRELRDILVIGVDRKFCADEELHLLKVKEANKPERIAAFRRAHARTKNAKKSITAARRAAARKALRPHPCTFCGKVMPNTKPPFHRRTCSPECAKEANRKKLTDAQIEEIHDALAQGEGVVAISKRFGVTFGLISAMKHGRVHKREDA